MINPLASSTQMLAFLGAMQIDTPAIRWLRTSVTPEMRAAWAKEDKALNEENTR